MPATRAGVGAVAVQAGSRSQWRARPDDGLTAAEAAAALSTEAQFAAVGTAGLAVAVTDADCVPAAAP